MKKELFIKNYVLKYDRTLAKDLYNASSMVRLYHDIIWNQIQLHRMFEDRVLKYNNKLIKMIIRKRYSKTEFSLPIVKEVWKKLEKKYLFN